MLEMQQDCALTSHTDRIVDPVAQAWTRLSMAEVRRLLQRPDPHALQQQHHYFVPQMLGAGAEVTAVAPVLIQEETVPAILIAFPEPIHELPPAA